MERLDFVNPSMSFMNVPGKVVWMPPMNFWLMRPYLGFVVVLVIVQPAKIRIDNVAAVIRKNPRVTINNMVVSLVCRTDFRDRTTTPATYASIRYSPSKVHFHFWAVISVFVV
jgi:hypothetical protein